MSVKSFPLTRAQLEELAKTYPTPFYVYDEAAIRRNAQAIKKAFSVFPGYKEHFAVKALPNPYILKILESEGFGADCSSLPELLLADMSGMKTEAIMLTSNETPAKEYIKARELGAIINLDDFTHIEYVEKSLAGGLPELVSCRYNPGPLKEGNAIIGKPEEAKYGFTREQLFDGYKLLKQKGVKRFGLHTMVASNELSLDYHLETGRLLFELAVEIKNKTGIGIEFVNLGGGLGIPYKPEQEAVSWDSLASGLKKLYDEIVAPSGLKLEIHTEYGRPVTGPYGWLVARAIHSKHIYREYIALDASMADLMRPALYGAYHHITIPGKENAPLTETYDVVGSLCENNDKFAVQRKLPKICTSENTGDFVVIHDAGAHGRAMGFNYNGKLRCGELLLRSDGTIKQIRRAETVEDYFATIDLNGVKEF
ncbi:diaminopimelate decarboxylase family protein [Leadbettera azotonutricia]|uniref:Diaminopimelate decarboxylase n=1 Tax=Leadbettera azotonutricia (strain ATCC BAA-888 / DSM 13862 / ZAS-9) TaxID=545695 RepID=F5YFZ9_LEAAZ|nr:diaminopimelate decarboxylase [Leadbettera azotonutricia]AEF81300.1 diaminopimelate decarboxylase [Leadbettera azotonutricia ZAS-9]